MPPGAIGEMSHRVTVRSLNIKLIRKHAKTTLDIGQRTVPLHGEYIHAYIHVIIICGTKLFLSCVFTSVSTITGLQR